MRFRVPIGQAAGQKKCTFSLWSYAQIRRDDPTSNVIGDGDVLDPNEFDFRPTHDEPLRDGYHFPTPPKCCTLPNHQYNTEIFSDLSRLCRSTFPKDDQFP